jgi:hypothetical protein
MKHLFWILGLLIIFKVFYEKKRGDYYTGRPLVIYHDTLKQKARFSKKKEKGGLPNRYHLLTTNSNNEFVIGGTGVSLIGEDPDAQHLMSSLGPGAPITLTYEKHTEFLITGSHRVVRVFGLASGAKTILDAAECIQMDQQELRSWYIVAGLLFLISGVIIYVSRETEEDAGSE